MNEPGPEGGWNFLRILGFLVGLIGMAGFGICGVVGLLGGATAGEGFASIMIVCGLIGIGIAAVFFLLMRAMLRRAKGE